jgi:threonine aldolase
MNCDYLEGAHPNILNRLMQTNYDQTVPYGFDEITESAKEKIKKACECPEGEVFFMVGGTQTNATMLDFILDKAEGVISADTGHISVHEAGAVEYCGRKVITIPAQNGKLSPAAVREYMENFYGDATWFHMV